jgi:hypothetical protein
MARVLKRNTLRAYMKQIAVCYALFRMSTNVISAKYTCFCCHRYVVTINPQLNKICICNGTKFGHS